MLHLIGANWMGEHVACMVEIRFLYKISVRWELNFRMDPEKCVEWIQSV
jgi:hypothetical protein